ncbi:MAG: hypothetical protein ACRDYZ_15445 [Acidimicrobiales bacterium]
MIEPVFGPRDAARRPEGRAEGGPQGSSLAPDDRLRGRAEGWVVLQGIDQGGEALEHGGS